VNEQYFQVWRAKTRRERGRIVAMARRGLKARTPGDAALVSWWAWRQLQRGPWPALTLAVAAAIAVVVLSAAFAEDPSEVFGSPSTWAPGFVLYPGIALAGWRLRRPRLRSALVQNLSVVSGRTYAQPPADDQIQRVLTKAARKLT
jgi:hypothetical protein